VGPGRTGDILCRPVAAPPLLGSEAASAGPQAPPSAPPAGSAASASPALEHPVHGIATTSTYIQQWFFGPHTPLRMSYIPSWLLFIQFFNLEVTKQLTECHTTESKALLLLLEVYQRYYKGFVNIQQPFKMPSVLLKFTTRHLISPVCSMTTEICHGVLTLILLTCRIW